MKIVRRIAVDTILGTWQEYSSICNNLAFFYFVIIMSVNDQVPHWKVGIVFIKYFVGWHINQSFFFMSQLVLKHCHTLSSALMKSAKVFLLPLLQLLAPPPPLHVMDYVVLQTDGRCTRFQELLQDGDQPGSAKHHPDSGLFRVPLPDISPDGRGGGCGPPCRHWSRLSNWCHLETMVTTGTTTGDYC